MNKFTCSILAMALSFSVCSASAATSNTDDTGAVGASENQQPSQDALTTDSVPNKKSMTKKDRINKKNKKVNSETQEGTNASSMNNKPIGTTTGVSTNGSVDETKDGPINGTHTGTNNDSTR